MRASSINRSPAVVYRATTAALALAAAPLAALGQSADPVLAANASAADGAVARIESVTVTARRREESAQEVPIPITTLSGAALEDAGEFRLEDLNRRLPSTNVQFGNPRQSSIAVRGLGNNPANDALEASVGVYLDNVYLGRPGMANLDLIDIDQVALLRGPQGTLFGKNTTAGVLNISTRQPTFEPSAQLESSFGNRDYYQVRGAIAGPIAGETLAGRLSVAQTSKGGFVHDVIDGRDLNGSKRTGLRGQLLYRPTQALSLRVIGDYNEEDSDAAASVLYGLGPNDGALVRARYAELGIPLILDPDYGTTILNSPQHMAVRQGGGSVEANYDFGQGYRLTSITAYRSWWFTPTNDGDGSNLSAIINAGQHVDDEQWTQEIRIASPTGGAVDYVAGLYYLYQNQVNTLFTQYGPDAGRYLGRPVLNDAFSLIDQYLRTDSYSAFGQATWHATDTLGFTLGARQTVEDKSTRVRRNPPVGGQPGVEAALGLYETGTLERSDSNTSVLLSASWQATDDTLWYVSAAKGAKSGGINPAVPSPGFTVRSLYIEPEKATDAELGVKSTLFDDRLQLNANLYWTDVTDYQATALELSTLTGTFQQVLSNIGKVRSRGVETEVTAVPLPGLTLSLAASLNDARYRDYRNAPCSAEAIAAGRQLCDLSGGQIVGAPKWIVNPSIGYTRDLGALEGYLQADYAWRSSFYGSPDNSRFAQVDPYGVVNLQLGVTGKLAVYEWQLALWARNLTDERYVIGGLSGASQFLTYSLFPGEPRAYGATVRLNF
ncbi:MAG TPA: TonB-dependent receptor [Steroidobacteraceae bacterium]|nr:TonB-dependent receptor [Steroidobacteraceae bacterium]